MTVTTERRGLGRGLGELFQRTDVPASEPAPQEPAQSEPLVPVPAGSSYADLPLESIVPNPRQPRTVFDGDALDELVDSIREVGLLQPVVVRPLGDDTAFIPGHGQPSNFAHERAHNMFVSDRALAA